LKTKSICTFLQYCYAHQQSETESLHKVAKEKSETVVHLPAQVTTGRLFLKILSVPPMGLGTKIPTYYAKVREFVGDISHLWIPYLREYIFM
jgi:hypothetical protein